MARIKKQGLDYFPLDTDFMQQRTVRRLMRQQGDRAFTVLLSALSAIYGGEGYYVHIDDAFCEDLATDLFDTDAPKVKDILLAAIELGLFDGRLYREYGILTSAHIQEQFLFCSKRRRRRGLDERFRLVENGQEDTAGTTPNPGDATNATGDATEMQQRATQMQQRATTPPQSTAQQSTAQQSPKEPLPKGSPDGRTPSPEEAEEKDGEIHDDAWWTRRIARLAPPADHRARNYDGLLFELQRWKVPPQEQYALILKSSFGAIGHPVWLGISEIVKKPKDIRQPGRFLLSKCK